MKVILLEDIDGLGKKFEVKEVKSGYARNFLIPKNLAKLANKINLKWLQIQKKIAEEQAEEDLKKSQALATQIDGLEIIIPVKIGQENQLFESINAEKISEKLKEMGFEVKKSRIILEKPIKELGEFNVKLNLDHNLETEVRVIVTEEKT